MTGILYYCEHNINRMFHFFWRHVAHLTHLAPSQDLLEAKPEGEGLLLALLVNKLGDPGKKISSKVRYAVRVAKMSAAAVRKIRPRVDCSYQYVG